MAGSDSFPGDQTSLGFAADTFDGVSRADAQPADPELKARFLADMDELRNIPGCPQGGLDDFVALGRLPWYTPCPNPFLREFLDDRPNHSEAQATGAYSVDVAHTRAGAIYNAHSYPTKVPPEAIVQYILHYTRPGETVLDLFAGTGMTGVAAQLCGSPPKKLRELMESVLSKPAWGTRRAVLSDLSTLATFIAANLNMDVDPARFTRYAERILSQAEDELGWLYEVEDSAGTGVLNYAIWSELLICPNCSVSFDFWSQAVDHESGGIRREWDCPHCGSTLTKTGTARKTRTVLDPLLNQPVEEVQRVPVMLNYTVKGNRHERDPSDSDLALLERANDLRPSSMVPIVRMLFKDGAWGDLYRSGYHQGITHVHHFYFRRSLLVLGRLWELAREAPRDVSLQLRFLISSYNVSHSTLMSRVIFKKGNPKPVLTGYQTGALYISSLPVEKNVFLGLRQSKLPAISKAFREFRRTPRSVYITTQSATDIQLPPDSVDYVFVDPPFGDNIQYAEGNFISEAWLGCYTNQDPEAVVSPTQEKGPDDYRKLMESAFRRAYAALKPGRWMTVQFHNSQNRIWAAVQEAITGAGFVIADVSTLDKRQGSFKQVTTRGAVKQDLMISAYKPETGVQDEVAVGKGSESAAWAFVRGHLAKVAMPTTRAGSVEVVPERLRHLLFDRMVGYHVLQGVTVPLSAAEFYQGLLTRFPERDEMYFLPEQVGEYDKLRARTAGEPQLSLFVSDEASAIEWLRAELEKRASTYQELHPLFIQNIHAWERHESPLELRDLLEDNFLRYEGEGAVPSQLHSYLSSNFRNLRNKDKDDPELIGAAAGRWYVPDPAKQADLERLRQRSLLKEFDRLRASKEKRLKQLRVEAVRAGFKAAYERGEYDTITRFARRIPDEVLHSDEQLVMYYDVARMRLGQD